MSTSQRESWVRVRELPLSIEAADPPRELAASVSARLGLRRGELGSLRIVQRALDARKRPPRYVYAVEVALEPALAARLVSRGRAEPAKRLVRTRWRLAREHDGPPPVVVGAGPAGLMAALTLAEAGLRPVLVERGKPVEERVRDVSRLYREGVLDGDSNVCYGEGGAGTFSDGKLYTRVGDDRVRLVMETFVAHGADADILIDNRPHLGTDRLVTLLARLREHLARLGVALRFGSAIDELVVAGGELRGLVLRGGERLDARQAVLATGHSAREVWEGLAAAGLPLELRPFAVGFRVEHPQALIDELRYGRSAAARALPAADYRLTYNEAEGERRGVYSFCMCPGGVVVTTPTRQEELCINGMSHASRAGRFANSALVVTVGPGDFAPHASRGVFAGVAFQESVERAAYLAGGGAFQAPAARLSDFAAGRVSTSLPATSYRRGIVAADLATLYPAPVIAALRRALGAFDRRMRGFVTGEAKLIGVETRTASPIRLPRGDDLQATGARGLYPAGEGMGYGGGIVSAAVDGMRAAEALLASLGAERIEVGEGAAASA